MKRLHLKDAIRTRVRGITCRSCNRAIGKGEFYNVLWIDMDGHKGAWHLDCENPTEYPLAISKNAP